jgi:hypothetical protein
MASRVFDTQDVESMGIEPGKHLCHGQAKPKCDSPASGSNTGWQVRESMLVILVTVANCTRPDDDLTPRRCGDEPILQPFEGLHGEHEDKIAKPSYRLNNTNPKYSRILLWRLKV